MIKFSNQFKNSKKLFLAYFPYFWGKIFFPKKFVSFTHNTTQASNTMLRFQKKMMSKSQENLWMKGRKNRQKDMGGWTDPNSQDPSGHDRGFKKPTVQVYTTFQIKSSREKISKKSSTIYELLLSIEVKCMFFIHEDVVLKAVSFALYQNCSTRKQQKKLKPLH